MRKTDPAWARHVMAHIDPFLCDHANCERKAAAMALSLVSRYSDRHLLVDAMLTLAQEELAHFHDVYRVMASRGLFLTPEDKDPYVNALRKLARDGREARLMDQLLIAGVIETRGCERFGLVAEALPPGALKDFYTELTRAEARHGGLFVRLAREYFPAADVEARLEALFVQEADIMVAQPLRATLH